MLLSLCVRYATLCSAFLPERRRAFDAEYNACSVASRLSRLYLGNNTSGQFSYSGSGSDVASSSGSVVTIIPKQRLDAGRASSSTVKVGAQVVNRSKSLDKSDGTSSKGKAKKHIASVWDSIVKPKYKKKGSERNDDPDVVHRKKKPSKK